MVIAEIEDQCLRIAVLGEPAADAGEFLRRSEEGGEANIADARSDRLRGLDQRREIARGAGVRAFAFRLTGHEDPQVAVLVHGKQVLGHELRDVASLACVVAAGSGVLAKHRRIILRLVAEDEAAEQVVG